MISSTPPVIAVLLAAGLSRRMGQPKQTLPWGATTLTLAVGASISAMGLPVVAVVPPWLGAEAPPWALAWVANAEPQRGLSESIRLGVAAAEKLGRWAGMAFFLGDQPFVTEADVAAVLRAFFTRAADVHAVRPLYGGRPGHPVVVDAGIWSAADRLEGDIGFGQWLKGRIQGVPVEVVGRPDPAADLDTPEDYARYQKLAQGWSRSG